MKVRRCFTGSPWEPKVGYCRALRTGDHVYVSGTAPVAEGGGVHAPGDAYGQARRCFEIVEKALGELGAGLGDVVRTRMYVTDVSRWEEFGSAHAEFFGQVHPATSLIGVSRLVDPDMLVGAVGDLHVARGEGVRWFRRFLGEDDGQPIRHPQIPSAIGSRIMGVALRDKPGDTAAALIPSVGCPLGCNFCSTSAMFGGKGKSVNFYKTGDELFDVMCQLERELHARSFFIMDENFLLQKERAMDLLARMKQARKSWALNIFSSANAIRKYSCEKLVELGVSSIWLGLESPRSNYSKLDGADTALVVDFGNRVEIRVLVGQDGVHAQIITRKTEKINKAVARGRKLAERNGKVAHQPAALST